MSNQPPPYGGSHSGDRYQADDGEQWPEYESTSSAPPQQAVVGRQVTTIVLAVIVVGVLLFCGSGIAVLVMGNRAMEDISGGRPGPELLAVEEGESFQIAGFAVDDGWYVGADPRQQRRTTVLGLIVENTTDEPNSVGFDVTFDADGDEVGAIMCMSELIEPGESAEVHCDSIRRDISGYDEILVVGHYEPWAF